MGLQLTKTSAVSSWLLSWWTSKLSFLNWICTCLTCLSLGIFDALFVMFRAQAVALELGLGFGGISVREGNSTGSAVVLLESLQSKDEESKFLVYLLLYLVCCSSAAPPCQTFFDTPWGDPYGFYFLAPAFRIKQAFEMLLAWILGLSTPTISLLT